MIDPEKWKMACEQIGGSEDPEVGYVYPPLGDPATVLAMLERVRCREIMLPICKGCVPCEIEYHEPELWIDVHSGKWLFRLDSWAETYMADTAAEAIVNACAALSAAK